MKDTEKTREQLLDELVEMRNRIAELEDAKEALRKSTFDLRERAKELDCLYGVSLLFEKSGDSLDALLPGVAELLPPAWQHPHLAYSRIVFGGQTRASANYKQTQWRQQRPIKVDNTTVGQVEVGYLGNPLECGEEAFLPQEGKLLDVVAERLGRAIERTQVRRALRESEERVSLALSGANLGLWDWNLETGEVLFNERWAEMLGYTLDEIGPHVSSWERLLHPEDIRRVMDKLSAHLEGKTPYYESEHRLLAKSGDWVWVLDKGKVTDHDEQGRPRRVVGTHLDITERKILEIEREQYFRLFTTSNDLMAIFDLRTGCINKVNPSGAGLLGYAEEELVDRRYMDLIHPDDRQRTLDGIQLQFERGQTANFENRYLRKDGTIRWLSWEATQDMVSGITYATARDITERKQHEAEIRRFRAIVLSSDDAIVSKTLDGIVTSWNPGAEKIFGYTAADMIGNPMTPLFPPELIDEEQAILERLARGEIVHHYVSRRIRKDGSLIDVSVTISPILDDAGRIVGASKIARDITEQVEREKELEVARANADAANQAKSEFLSIMSHEIRTPMTGIMGMAQLLERTALSDKQSEYLAVIRRSSEALLSLINDVLDLSKIEAGKIELDQRDFTLRGSISDVIKTQISLIHDKGLSIQTEIPDEVPDSLFGDYLRLKQILLNLLSNAIKFTEKGDIRLTAAVSERHGDSMLLKIGVTDSGIGIGAEAMKKIFKPFVQADASTTRKYGGTGLGLSISTRLAELMGGRIWAESKEGVGSNFFLQLPFVVREFAVDGDIGRSGDKVSPLWDVSTLQIVIVDAQDTNRFFVSRLLQRAGHTVIEACDGREALQKWEQGACDLILMDIQMPVMSGIEVTRLIREREKETGGHIPIIAITARALQRERDMIMSKGFDGYLAMPIEIDRLFSEMQACLPERFQRTDLEGGPLPSMPEAAAPAVDREHLAVLLKEIEALLRSKNVAVIDKVSALNKAVAGEASIDTFKRYVKQLDFGRALTCLEEVYHELNITR